MEFIKTFVELIPGLPDYPWWVKVLVFMTLLFVFACIVTFIFVPKLEPVDNWRLRRPRQLRLAEGSRRR
jgi:hypothetical protein